MRISPLQNSPDPFGCGQLSFFPENGTLKTSPALFANAAGGQEGRLFRSLADRLGDAQVGEEVLQLLVGDPVEQPLRHETETGGLAL